jgi:multidrug resistance efflux pump
VVIAVIVAVGIIAWLYWVHGRSKPLIVSGFIEADEIRVGSRVGGRVADVLVDEGARVMPGQPLYRIDPFDLDEQLAQSKAQLAAYQAESARLKAGFRKEEIEQARGKRDQVAANLAKLLAGPRKQEIEVAREQLNIAKAALEEAESEYARVERLRTEAQAAQREYDVVLRALKSARAQVASAEQQLALLEEGSRKEDVAEARAGLAEAEAALNLMESGYRAEDIAQAEARVSAAQAAVAAIEVRMKELTVASPCDCVVEAIDLRPGDLVAQNAPSVTLLHLSDLHVRAYVPEARLGQTPLGGKVPIRVDSFGGERFLGQIVFISRDAEFTPRNVQTPEERSKQVFRIKVKLLEGLDRLRAGMTADVLLGEASRP